MPRADCTHTTITSAVMTRAWAIFRSKFNYSAVPFRSIGRRCFTWALQSAWAEARAAAKLAATSTEAIQAQVDWISRDLEGLKYRGWGTNLVAEHNRLNEQLRPLAKELLRRSLAASLEQDNQKSEPLKLAA